MRARMLLTTNLLLLLLLLSHIASAQDAVGAGTDEVRTDGDCSRYNQFLTNGRIDYVNRLVLRSEPDGTLYVNPDRPEDLPGLLQAMGVEDGVTFEMVKETKSRLNESKLYRKYQQFYHGVEVEGGGYTMAYMIPGTPTDPCLPEAYMMVPHILTDLSLNANPSIAGTSIPDILHTDAVAGRKLVVAYNLNDRCEYVLAWRVEYGREHALISWVDAQTGAIVKTVDATMNHNAPTVTYGPQFLNDETIGNTTSLRSPDGSVVVRNFGANCPNNPVNTNQWTNALVPTTTNPTDWTTEATPNQYQMFWVTSQVAPLYETIGVDFGTVNVGTCAGTDAFAFFGSTVDNAFISIGTLDGNSLALFDVIGHELGHVFLFQFLEYTNMNNRTLHEGISDILGTYMESLVQGSVDWVIGDDVPAVASDPRIDRNLRSPRFDCVTTAPTEHHERGMPLGHWYFLIAQGDPASGIPALGLQPALNILLEALPLLTVNSGYEDLKAATLKVAEEEFGKCSNQYLAVARAWAKICMGSTPVCNYTLSGPNEVCEESNSLNICVSGGLPGTYYRWYIIGKKSTEFTSQIGMQGNTQEGGNCLTLTHFPTYPYYPQYITIEAYAPSLGTQYIQRKRIKIVDCDGDDPTCQEYYDLQDGSLEERKQVISIPNEHDQQPQFVRAFDLVGRLIYEGVSDGFDPFRLDHHGMAILVYQNNAGAVVQVKKVFLRN